MIRQITKLLSIVNSNKEPGEIALGVVFGMFAGFLLLAPFNAVIIFLLVLVLNVNTAAFFLFTGIFKLITFLIDPLGDIIGRAVLTVPFLEPVFSKMAEMPLVPFTKFNNTVIMGDFIIGLLLIVPVWMGTLKVIDFYRKHMQDKVKKFGIVKALKAGNFFEGGDKE
ncbi:MAG: TIGR03546 family protein [Candidatus Goldbacteria bacterium]|nr:TIGR03546 family protein [Candidatus Goldiibacteriota bacterium]